jgi:hypothetical protein
MARNNTQHELSPGLQLSYLLLFATSCVGALWQKGDPRLTIAVLAAVVPLGLLARIPRRWFPGWLRQLFQIGIGAIGVAWWHKRMAEVPVDIALVEAAAVLSSALILGGLLKEYGLLGTISLILMGFGGLSPGRPVYLPSFGLFIVLGTILLYQTRTLRLVAAGEGRPRPEFPRGLGNWGYCLAHLVMVAAFFLILISSFPMPRGKTSPGVVPVSFHTEQGLDFPQLWKHWIRPAQDLIIKKNAPQTTEKGEKPNSIEKDAQKTAKAKEPTQFDAREGEGGYGIGTDLVFRVHSPAKLYWLAQLYDVYNGKRWYRSKTLWRELSGLDSLPVQKTLDVEQFFSVEKAISPHLCAAFQAENFKWGSSARGITRPDEAAVVLRQHLGGAEIRTELPPLPWRYQVLSRVPTLDSQIDIPPDEDYQRKGWNYRRLPDKIISKRLRQLALDLTATANTPLEKALTLRNYLRENYTYSINPPPIPEDREVVDAFLFETREGYCQHFAQALTVLARLAGLQSRLASGYSPGNYNLLANCFEVYEYHAHVWTQIFVPPYGWLTFDGVAPGNLRIENTPAFLENFLDPFGEEWAAHPPELALRAPKPKAPLTPEQSEKEEQKRKDRNKLVQACEDVYAKAVLESGSMDPEAKDIAAAAIQTVTAWMKKTWDDARKALAAWGIHVWGQVRGAWASLVDFLAGLSVADYLGTALVMCFVVWLWRRRERLVRWGRNTYARLTCNRLWRELQKSEHEAPEAVVRRCLTLVTGLSSLAHCWRPPNSDIVEYAQWLSENDPAMAPAFNDLSRVATAMLFSGRTLSRSDASTALDATARLRDILLPRLRYRNRRPNSRPQKGPSTRS